MFLIVVVYWSHTLVSTALRIAVATIPYLQYIQDVRFLHGQITCCSFTSAARRAREVLEVLNSAHFTRVYMVHSTSPSVSVPPVFPFKLYSLIPPIPP